MFASLKNKIKEETGNEVPVLTIRSNSTSSSRYSRGTESIASTSSSIDELSIIEQKDAEIQALRIQLSDVTTKFIDAGKRNDTLEDIKIQLENDNQLLEESIKVAQSQKDIICEEQDKIQNLQAQEISKLKSLLLFREQEALDRLSILKQTQHQVENLKHELARVKKYEPMLEEIQDEFEQFRHESQLEKNNLLSTLAAVKEENRFLKSRLEIFENSTVNFLQNLPIDEKIETLLNERKLLQQRLEEAHIHLQDVKSTWSGQNLTLETQLSRLSRQVAEETGEKRKIEGNYDLALDKLKQFENDIVSLENQVIERNNKIKILEDEIEDLSTTLKAVRLENDDEIKYLQSKVEENVKRKSELTTRLSVSDMKLNEFMENAEKNSKNLKDELYSLEEQVKNLNNLLEKERFEKRNLAVTNTELSQNEDIYKMELLRKRDEMSELNERINLLLEEQTEKESKLNELYSELDNLKQINKLNQDKINNYDNIENDLMDKIKTIKILNQRLVDMKKTLQQELKTNCNGSSNNNNNNNNFINNLNNSHNNNSNDNNICDKDIYKLCLNNSNGNKIVMDEVNFKYLKHVVFKFLTSREVEARHLIRAVSTLLHLSTDEEKLLHDTLNWKMSWFGSKPDHGTGQLAISIPPGF